MTPFAYTLSMLTGVILIGAGVACRSVPDALVTVGGLVISLTLVTAAMTTRRKGG